MTLDELEALLAKATPGPWKHDDLGHVTSAEQEPESLFYANSPMRDRPVARCGAWEQPTSYPRDWMNGEFIAAARNMLPELIAEVKRLRLEIDCGGISADDDGSCGLEPAHICRACLSKVMARLAGAR